MRQPAPTSSKLGFEHVLVTGRGRTTLLLLHAAPADAAPVARSYSATLTGTQESRWTFEETGTCTGDDFETHPFTGTGPGTSYPAQLLVTRDGRFAYLANRGHNSLTRYAVEAAGARLRLLDTVPVGGDFPRQIAFSPDQRWLFAANQKSGSVTVFSVNPRTGTLDRTGTPFTAPVPVCVLPR